jgi:hypothetical protein
MKENQFTEQLYENKSSQEKARQEMASLHEQINHLEHMKKLELSEMRVEYENIIHSLGREGRKEQEVSAMNYEMEIKKVKNQLNLKRIEAEQMASQV